MTEGFFPMAQPRTRISATVLGAPDAQALGAFYARLLGWNVLENDPGWVRIKPPDGGTGLSFQDESEYVPPVWPPQPGQQQMMSHLDIGVEDLQAGVDWAVGLGATLAEFQPQEHVRVMLDPAGHPFCLFPSQF
jgi:catechol 2,3-dioxygenase-like lactoylglutathione lyase family enzyme